jgi:hypothetical protein
MVRAKFVDVEINNLCSFDKRILSYDTSASTSKGIYSAAKATRGKITLWKKIHNGKRE